MINYLKNKYFLFPYILLAFLFPFPNHIVATASTFLFVFWLLTEIQFKFRDRIRSINSAKFILLPAIFYLLHVISYFFSANKNSAQFDLEVKLALLAFPTVFFFSYERIKPYTKIILLSFVSGCFVICIFLLGRAFWNSIYIDSSGLHFNSITPIPNIDTNTEPSNNFKYIVLSYFKHPSYLSLYIIIALIILTDFSKKKIGVIKTFNLNIGILYTLAILLFVIMIYLLSSRTNIILFFILLIIYSFWQLRKNKLIITVALAVTIIVGGIAIKYNNRFYYTIKEITHSERLITLVKEKRYNDIFTGFGIYRLPIFLAGMDMAKSHFLFGVGNGDVKDELMMQYDKYGMSIFKENSLNAHNQYIETLFGLGLIGLMALLAMTIIPLILGLKDSFMLAFFIISVIVNFINESMLNTISGTIFISFFYCLFLMWHSINNTKIN